MHNEYLMLVGRLMAQLFGDVVVAEHLVGAVVLEDCLQPQPP